MMEFLSKVNIQVNENIYLKNPDSSNLGKNIISGSIDLIEKMGFEAFTFRKLGNEINSTEASIYRYFESKHKLLLYLINWYWAWMEYRLVFSMANINSPEERLQRAITLLTEEYNSEKKFNHIDTQKLFNIVIQESSKSYLIKEVDKVNQEGAFLAYKQLVGRVGDIILEINPKYKYPHMLISTVIEGAHHQRFFAEHLPRLTDVADGEATIPNFYNNMVLKTIKNEK
ncbi:helix-turn-helix transcriptional regulator [Hyphobacterium sp. CCMP332]|nr:helix-turn-helix transcriptional regulator [Hyphobacterium sp. CCMP332]